MNNTKARILIAAAALASIAFSSSARAQIILSAGPLKFSVGSFYASGTTGAGQAAGAQQNLAAPGTTPLPQYVGDNPALKFEDTWGIFSISEITQDNDALPTKYTPLSAGYQLFGIFYGSVDQSQSAITPFPRDPNVPAGEIDYRQTFLAGGLMLDIYKVTNNAVLFANLAQSQGPSGHTALDQFNGITNMGYTKVLSAAVNSGGLSSTAIYDTANPSTLLTSSSNGILDVTSFSASAFSVPSGTNFSSLEFRLESGVANGGKFLLSGTGTAQGDISAVPEPSTYALFGVVALMSLVVIRRVRGSKHSVEIV